MTDATAPPRRVAARRASVLRRLAPKARDGRVQGWIFVTPALAAYAVFVLWPLGQTFRYSLYRWDGIAPAEWAGLDNFRTVFTDEKLVAALKHAFELIVFFSGIPVVLGLVIASVMRRFAQRRATSAARVVLFLPQVV